MEFKTKISKIENSDLTLRGEKLSLLVRTAKFTDVVFLQLSGRKPEEKEGILFEKLLISVIDHGMGTTSSMSTRFIASGGNDLNVAVGGGILSIGDYHGGAIEKAMKQFYEWKDMSQEEVKEQIKNLITNKKTLYGFGHKIYKEGDPRVEVMIEEIKRIAFESNFLQFKEIVEGAFVKIKNKKIPINIDGFIALLLCDFGFDALLGKGIFIVGRTSGLVAQAYEELKEEKPVRRVSEDHIVYTNS
jgi:citrate synthase